MNLFEKFVVNKVVSAVIIYKLYKIASRKVGQ